MAVNDDTDNQRPSKAELIAKKIDIKKWLIRSTVAVMAIAAAIYFAPKILYSLSHESTDDAYVQGTAVPVSAEVKGRVVKVFVEQARGNLEAAITDEKFADKEIKRYTGMVKSGAISQSQHDQK